MTTAPQDPIRMTVTVPLAPRAGFDLFAGGIDRWWPKESHSLAVQDGNGTGARVRVEPCEGGRVIETLPDGTEAPWADVTCYVPGKRLTLRWYVGRPQDGATMVDIRFRPVDAGTRIDLTHSGFAVLGFVATATCASYTSGWDHVLGHCFARGCDKTAPALTGN